jgi:hypothetical protein
MVGIRTCGHPVENLKMRRRWWRYYGLRNLLDFEETIFQFPVVLEMHMNHMTNYHVETKSDKTMSCLYIPDHHLSLQMQGKLSCFYLSHILI